MLPFDIAKRIVVTLSRHVSAERVLRMREVLASRNDNIRVVLENIHDPWNATACLR